MPKIYAPRDLTITTVFGSGATLKKGETREVSPEFFAEALLQGAFPASDSYDVVVPAPRPVVAREDDTTTTEFDSPGLDNATLVGEEDEDRYPAAVTQTPPAPGTVDEHAILDALRRIAARNDPRDFNTTGVPKARALTAELNGVTVVAEIREAAWEKVAKELGR